MLCPAMAETRPVSRPISHAGARSIMQSSRPPPRTVHCPERCNPIHSRAFRTTPVDCKATFELSHGKINYLLTPRLRIVGFSCSRFRYRSALIPFWLPLLLLYGQEENPGQAWRYSLDHFAICRNRSTESALGCAESDTVVP